jgi:hypothetical protein
LVSSPLISDHRQAQVFTIWIAQAQTFSAVLTAFAQPRVYELYADQDGIFVETNGFPALCSAFLSPQPAWLDESSKFRDLPGSFARHTWYKHPVCVFPADKSHTFDEGGN